KVLGVHPAEGHDIPGVRSLKALRLTDFFLPKEYDGVVEVANAEAYRLCKRINQEESIIAGPSSGMALAGALKLVPDEPGATCVVTSPENISKYTGSIRKLLPDLSPAEASLVPPPAAEPSANDIIEPAEVVKRVRGGALLLDVRTDEEYKGGHIAEA